MSSYVKVEKLLLISMSMILILLTPYGNGYVVESVQSEETFKESINNLANWKRYGFKIFVKGLGYVDIPQPAYYEAGANYTTASSGTFRFNSGDYGSAIRKVENLKTTQYKADMWAVTLNLFAKISLIAIAPNQEMKSMRATTSQRMWVDPNDSIFNKSTGEYLLLFSDTAKQSWNAWVTYWHFENRFQCPDPSKPCPSPVGENELEQKVIVSSLLDNQQKQFTVVQHEDFNLIKPSKEHKSFYEKFKWRTMDIDKIYLTYGELLEQRIDVELGEIVFNFRDINIGDTVVIKDTIRTLEYDSDENITYIGFNGVKGYAEIETIPFEGDISSRFRVGDEIKLEVDVVNFIDGTDDFQITNIEKEFLINGTVPRIDEYLVN